MRLTFALIFGVAVLSGAALGGQQSTPPPTIPPPTVPPVAGSRTFAPRPARSDTAVIIGQVVDSSGRGVPKAAVRLIGDSLMETVLTDQRGRFFFRTLPRGEVIVTAQKFGFFDGAYGKRRATGQPLIFSVALGQVIPDMRIEMFGAGVITGSVVDEAGEAIIGARVVAMLRQFVAGTWQHIDAGSEETDDEGMYRIFGLQPGEYIVSTPATSFSVPTKVIEGIATGGTGGGGITAVFLAGTRADSGQAMTSFLETRTGISSDGRDLVWTTAATPPDDDGRGGMYPAQFYPATDQRILALPVTIASGEVRYAVNFQLPLVPARRVTGQLVGDPKATANQVVRLMPIGSGAEPGDEAAMTVSEDDGRFAFARVPGGRYVLEAGNWGSTMRVALDRLPASAPTTVPKAFWARADVAVSDADVDLSTISMRPTVVLDGSVVFERPAGGSARVVSPGRLVITIASGRAGQSNSASLRVTPEGEFSAMNLVPGEYFLRVGALPPGWFIKSVTANGRDALDDPIDVDDSGASVMVTLTTRGTEIIGSVRDSRMQAAAGAAILILPVTTKGEAVWTPNRTRETRASTNGVFIVNGLPPGDYLIVAIDDAMAEGWQDARVLAMLRTLATRITLRDQERKTLQLRLSPVKR